MYKIKNMKNNIKIVYKKINYINSINLAIFIKSGSLYEDKETNGISHLLEHMTFKGTEKRDSKDIALDIDRIGGEINAYTTSDYTCFHMQTLASDIFKGMDILFDMIKNNKFTKEDLEIEKKVIYDEIDDYNDDVDELVFNYFNDIFFKDSYRYNVLGSKESLSKIQLKELLNYKKDRYLGENMVISLIGNFQEEKTLDYIERELKDIETIDKNSTMTSVPRINLPSSSFKYFRKELEQVSTYINIAKTLNFKKNKKEIILLNNIFGGSVSSKLFQNIREEKGLTYNINSFIYENNLDANMNIFFTSNNKNIVEVMEAILHEIKAFRDYKITYEDLKISKKQLIAEYLLRTEDPYEEMITIGENLILNNKIYNKNEIVDDINKINKEDLMYIKNRIFSNKDYNVICIGDISDINQNKLKNILQEEKVII